MILYNRLLAVIIVCIACSSLSCKDNRQVVEKEDIIPEQLTLLDSIRTVMHEQYKLHPQNGTEIPVTSSSPNSGCTPCDMQFLVYLSTKEDYNLNDIKTLLCLDDNDICDNNAEFVPFYNEMVFKVFNRERKDLSYNQIDSLLKDHELVEELENPMSDTNSKDLILRLKTQK